MCEIENQTYIQKNHLDHETLMVSGICGVGNGSELIFEQTPKKIIFGKKDQIRGSKSLLEG